MMKPIAAKEFEIQDNWILEEIRYSGASLEVWLCPSRQCVKAFRFNHICAVDQSVPVSESLERFTGITSRLIGDIEELSNRIVLEGLAASRDAEESNPQDEIRSFLPDQVKQAMCGVVKDSCSRLAEEGEIDGDFAEQLFKDMERLEGKDEWFNVVEHSIKAHAKRRRDYDIVQLLIEESEEYTPVDGFRLLSSGERIISTDEYRTARGWQKALGSNLVGKIHNEKSNIDIRRKTFHGDPNYSHVVNTQLVTQEEAVYRLLEEGEMIHVGDEFYSIGRWHTVTRNSHCVGNHFRKSEGKEYRRRDPRAISIG